MDISRWIGHWARWTPEKTALRFEGRTITYAELELRVGRVASWLKRRGTTRGDRIAYLGPNHPAILELLFACARIGAIFVPLNGRMPATELQVFVDFTKPRFVFSCDDVLDEGDECVEPRPTALDEPVLIAFTSGTTGRPKGATFGNRQLLFNALNAVAAWGLAADDEILTAVPMFHASGIFIHTTPALSVGATVTIHRGFDPRLLLEDIERHRVTRLASAPFMTNALVADAGWDAADLSSLRNVVTGSTVVEARAVEPWLRRGVPICQTYGMTEASPVCATLPPDLKLDAGLTAGRAPLHNELRVDEDGEVWLRGPTVMEGYWRNPDATAAVMRGGWIRTGDVGRIDEDGRLRIVGRLKDVIIVGSSNVHPADVEAVLSECDTIREAAVVGRPDDELGEVPVAFVVTEELSAADVLALFDGRLADYKHPRDVFFVDELPRTDTGKVDRNALRAMQAAVR